MWKTIGECPESRMSEQWILTAGHSCAQQYPARHHFPQDSNEWDTVVLKFQTHLYAVNSVVLELKGWKLCPGNLQIAASSTSLLPIGMQIPVASTEKSRGRSTPKL
jgi:hypothetical protein